MIKPVKCPFIQRLLGGAEAVVKLSGSVGFMAPGDKWRRLEEALSALPEHTKAELIQAMSDEADPEALEAEREAWDYGRRADAVPG